MKNRSARLTGRVDKKARRCAAHYANLLAILLTSSATRRRRRSAVAVFDFFSTQAGLNAQSLI